MALGVATEGVPAPPMDAPREPHPAMRPIARLYAAVAARDGVPGGAGDNGQLVELEPATGRAALEAAVLQEGQFEGIMAHCLSTHGVHLIELPIDYSVTDELQV